MSSPQEAETALGLCRNLSEIMPPGAREGVILDGGCHHGEFALKARQYYPGSPLLAFEPDPDSARIARHRFHQLENAELVEMALGDAASEAPLHRGARSATHSLLPRPDKDGTRLYFPEDARLDDRTMVRITTIDDACESRGIGHLHLMKLDLQGGELAALRGAKNTLSARKADIILTETVFIEKYEGQPLFPELWQALALYGYSFYALAGLVVGPYMKNPPGPHLKQWNQADAVFISPLLRELMDGLS